MKFKLLTLLLLSFITSIGCTDADWAKTTSLNSKHKITCWSGGVVIYDGESTGKVLNEEHSDGYFFEDTKTHKLVSVSGNCLITME